LDTTPRVILTLGEPAGIGPDIILQAIQQPWLAELIVIGDPALLTARAQQLQLPLQLDDFDAKKIAMPHQPGILKIIPLALNVPCTAGQLNPANSAFVIRCLELATDYCLAQQAHALVTGPIHKALINAAGIAFSGHTEFLATRCQAPQVLMLFVVDHLKVALVTTHLSLAEVPKNITRKQLLNTARLLHTELQQRFSCPYPKILVCGLNPHAGEGGYLGREEIEIIEPTLDILRAEGLNIIGPLPADTVFTEKYLASADAVLAMYHDQALPVVKHKSFNQAVNVTLGLPIIRTSVDHGTALDIAGTGQANPGSLLAAIQLAIRLAVN
jgi:4-hydroxythreonine-4-phosphate dehydrogenase